MAQIDRAGQRGMTLFGLLLWAVMVGFLGLMAIRSWPSINEYLTIQQSLTRIMKGDQRPGTPAEVRAAFDRQAQIEYSISSISGADLQVERVSDGRGGDVLEARFAYNKEIPIAGPVNLLIKYRGAVR